MTETAFQLVNDMIQVEFSPDGRYLVCAGHIYDRPGNLVHVYDLHKQRIASHFEVEFKKETELGAYGVNRIAFAADGQSIAFAAFDGSVLVWDWDPPKKRHVLPGHRGQARCVAFSPDGTRLASTGDDFRTKLWDAVSGKKLASFKSKGQRVEAVAFAPDGNVLAWGSETGYLTLLEVASRRELYTFRPHPGIVNSIAFSPNGKALAVAIGEVVKLLDPASGREILTLHGGGWTLAFSPDGSLIATTWDKYVLLWDVAKRQAVACVPVSKDHATMCARFSPDGGILAGSTMSTGVRLWNVSGLIKGKVGLSHLTGRIGTITTPTDLRTASEKATDFLKQLPKGTGMPAPAHLAHCTSRIKSKSSATKYCAHVRCPCGNSRFAFQHSCEVLDKDGRKFLREAKHGDRFFCIVEAECLACAKRHLLFDKDLHGWNGFVCRTPDQVRRRPELVPWVCPCCGQAAHLATVGVIGEPRQVSIEESGGILDENNWQEGFGSIDISLKCSGCSHIEDGWVSYETM